MQPEQVLQQLKSLANPDNVAGMARYGINTANTYGISIYTLRPMAKEIGMDHALAEQLWSSGIHEARILASMIDDPAKVTQEQMEGWVKDFDSWDVCDQVCSNLFDKTELAHHKATEWSHREEEFVKRAAFALMAALAIHDRQAPDESFKLFFPLIRLQATDGRNYVRKAVNWALRNIGKRNISLNRTAVATARDLMETSSKPARWVASDALRELTSEKVQKRLGNTQERPR
jgi:3-methyladenine DNA glycosylase AlkD